MKSLLVLVLLAWSSGSFADSCEVTLKNIVDEVQALNTQSKVQENLLADTLSRITDLQVDLRNLKKSRSFSEKVKGLLFKDNRFIQKKQNLINATDKAIEESIRQNVRLEQLKEDITENLRGFLREKYGNEFTYIEEQFELQLKTYVDLQFYLLQLKAAERGAMITGTAEIVGLISHLTVGYNYFVSAIAWVHWQFFYNETKGLAEKQKTAMDALQKFNNAYMQSRVGQLQLNAPEGFYGVKLVEWIITSSRSESLDFLGIYNLVRMYFFVSSASKARIEGETISNELSKKSEVLKKQIEDYMCEAKQACGLPLP